MIHERLRKFGVNGPGRDWLLRALHPASEEKSPGLPDQSSTAVLRPDFRVQATIQAPPETSSWDCIFWTPPGDVNAVYWATGPAGTDFTSQVAPSASCQVGALRLQPSIQSTLNTSFVRNSDSVDIECLTQVGGMQSAGFRHQFKSITINQIASAVSDQGQVYAAQFAPMLTTPGLVIPLGYDSGVPDPRPEPPFPNFQLYGELYQTVLPANEVDLAAMAPKYYMGPSREGIYMPLRLAGPAQPFARAKPHTTAFLAGAAGIALGSDTTLFANGAFFQPTGNVLAGTGSLIPWPFRAVSTEGLLGFGGNPLTVPEGPAMDTGYDNMNIGVVIFRGLQGGGGGGFASSLQLKCIAGLEVAPSPAPGVRVFAEDAAPYDPKALQAYYSIAMELEGVYPARFNGWGDIWDAIKSAVSSVGDFLKPVVSEVASKAVPILVEAGSGALQRGLTSLGGMALTGARGPRVAYRAPSVARSVSTAKTLIKTRSRAKKGKARRV